MKFNERAVLTNINLEITESSRIGIIGKIGSGKSTLINSLARTRGYKPSEGCVVFNITECTICGLINLPSASRCQKCGGEVIPRVVDIWNEPDSQLVNRIRQRVGIVYQHSFAVYGNLTALENVVEILRQIGIDPQRRFSQAAEILEAVNLLHRSSHLARDLSGGEKQRLGIARQLAKDPLVMLADDPTGALDRENADRVCKALEGAFHGRAVVSTSHMPRVIEMLSDSALILEDGKIMAEGSASNITKRFVKNTKPLHVERQREDQENIINLEDVSKIYHKSSSGVVKAVDGISLTVSEGVILGIVGQSGAGKTTITKVIAGLIQPTNGMVHIRIGDEWVSMKDTGEFGRGRATKYIGVLYQEYSLYSGMSVYENLAKSSPSDLPDEFIRLKVNYILREIGFTDNRITRLLEEYPDQLSEGERHRIALARVMVRDPLILILDEPSSTMDPLSKTQVSNALKSLANDYHTTVIVVSHDEEFAYHTCDRIVRMNEGKIVAKEDLTRRSGRL